MKSASKQSFVLTFEKVVTFDLLMNTVAQSIRSNKTLPIINLSFIYFF